MRSKHAVCHKVLHEDQPIHIHIACNGLLDRRIQPSPSHLRRALDESLGRHGFARYRELDLGGNFDNDHSGLRRLLPADNWRQRSDLLLLDNRSYHCVHCGGHCDEFA